MDSLSYSFKKLLFSKKETPKQQGRIGRERYRRSGQREKRATSPFEEVSVELVSKSQDGHEYESETKAVNEDLLRPREYSGFEEIGVELSCSDNITQDSNNSPKCNENVVDMGVGGDILKTKDKYDNKTVYDSGLPGQVNEEQQSINSEPGKSCNVTEDINQVEETADGSIDPEESIPNNTQALSDLLKEELESSDATVRPKAERHKPLTREQFMKYFDSDGRIVAEHEIKRTIFKGGVDDDIRRDVWQFLFELYPCNSTTRERDILKTEHLIRYEALKERWKPLLQDIAKNEKNGVKFCPDWFGKKRHKSSSDLAVNEHSAFVQIDSKEAGESERLNVNRKCSGLDNPILDSSNNDNITDRTSQERIDRNNENLFLNSSLDDNLKHDLNLGLETGVNNPFLDVSLDDDLKHDLKRDLDIEKNNPFLDDDLKPDLDSVINNPILDSSDISKARQTDLKQSASRISPDDLIFDDKNQDYLEIEAAIHEAMVDEPVDESCSSHVIFAKEFDSLEAETGNNSSGGDENSFYYVDGNDTKLITQTKIKSDQLIAGNQSDILLASGFNFQENEVIFVEERCNNVIEPRESEIESIEAELGTQNQLDFGSNCGVSLNNRNENGELQQNTSAIDFQKQNLTFEEIGYGGTYSGQKIDRCTNSDQANSDEEDTLNNRLYDSENSYLNTCANDFQENIPSFQELADMTFHTDTLSENNEDISIPNLMDISSHDLMVFQEDTCLLEESSAVDVSLKIDSYPDNWDNSSTAKNNIESNNKPVPDLLDNTGFNVSLKTDSNPDNQDISTTGKKCTESSNKLVPDLLDNTSPDVNLKTDSNPDNWDITTTAKRCTELENKPDPSLLDSFGVDVNLKIDSKSDHRDITTTVKRCTELENKPDPDLLDSFGVDVHLKIDSYLDDADSSFIAEIRKESNNKPDSDSLEKEPLRKLVDKTYLVDQTNSKMTSLLDNDGTRSRDKLKLDLESPLKTNNNPNTSCMPPWLAQQIKASSPAGTKISKTIHIHAEGLSLVEEDVSQVVPLREITEKASLAVQQKLIESKQLVRSSTPVEFDPLIEKGEEVDGCEDVDNEYCDSTANNSISDGDVMAGSHADYPASNNDVITENHRISGKETNDIHRVDVFDCDVSQITDTPVSEATRNRGMTRKISKDDNSIARESQLGTRGLRKAQSVSNITDFTIIENSIAHIQNSITASDQKMSKSESNINRRDSKNVIFPLPDIIEDGHSNCPYCGSENQTNVQVPDGFGEDWRRSIEIQAKVYAGRQCYNIENVCQALRIIDKDVPRTDRELPYFSGDGNMNLLKLRDALISYSFFHTDVGYAQGMNDIMSRFFVVMDSEADAYWMFCNYMEHFKGDFMENDMLRKINLVEQLLMKMDRELYDFLQELQMELIFCHRWLLLSFKREFSYEDGLRVFEIMSSRHLEVSSIDAEMERSRERARELEKDEGTRMEEIYIMPEYSFDVFLCVAMLHECRDALMQTDDVASIYQIISSLPQVNDLNVILSKAEDLFFQYCRKSTMDCFQLIDEPIQRTPNWKQRLHLDF